MLPSEHVKFATLNVRGIAPKKKQFMLRRLLLDDGIDVLALQETMLSCDERIGKALEPFLHDYEVYVSHAVENSAGCFLFLKKSLPLTNLNIITDVNGRFILADFVVYSNEYRVLCVYAPTSVPDRERFFTDLSPYLETEFNVIVLGDFNCIYETSDRSGSGYVNRSGKLLLEITDNHFLVDVAKLKAGADVLKFTRFQGSSHARLDRIYASVSLSAQIFQYSVTPGVFTNDLRAELLLSF